MFRISRSSILSMLAGVASFCPQAAHAQSTAGPSSAPQMNGSMSAPTQFVSGSYGSYTITQTDQDTYVNTSSNTTSTITDESCGVQAVTIQSFQGNNATAFCRGVSNTGTYTWDVIGPAVSVTQSTIMHDTWKLLNNRPNGDPYLDDPLILSQTVTVVPKAG